VQTPDHEQEGHEAKHLCAENRITKSAAELVDIPGFGGSSKSLTFFLAILIYTASQSSSMTKFLHEIRDPIHVFVRVESDRRKVLDSRPVQRLRHIHQLALSSYVYPGASHTRFEHS
jgi:hypothetical protein